MTYDEHSIRVLNYLEQAVKFDWVLAREWAARYHVPEAWLLRAFEACRRCGVSRHYIRRRYLDRNPKVRRKEAVDRELRAVLDEARR